MSLQRYKMKSLKDKHLKQTVVPKKKTVKKTVKKEVKVKKKK